MTSSLELITLAEKHSQVPAIKALLASIGQNQIGAQEALVATRVLTGSLENAALFKAGYSVSIDQADLVAAAAKAAASLSRLGGDMFNLANILQMLGEDIDF